MTHNYITTILIALIVSLPITLAEELSLVYDANGNLVTGDGIYREYNSLNQLWKVYNGSDSNGVLLQEYMHEPGEERVLMKKTFNESGLVETVYYPFKELTRVVNSSGTYDFTNVYHEGQLIAVRHPDGTKEFYHPDHLGSTTLITDSSGNAIENTSYTPFGVILEGGEESRYDYEAKEFDEVTGQYDFHFRGYKSEWGKFTQPDTLIQNVYDPQFLNRYAFERNNAYKYTDPTGHATTGDGKNIYYDNVQINDPVTHDSLPRIYSLNEKMPVADYNQAKRIVVANQVTAASPSGIIAGLTKNAAAEPIGNLLDYLFEHVLKKVKRERSTFVTDTDSGKLYSSSKGYYMWSSQDQLNSRLEADSAKNSGYQNEDSEGSRGSPRGNSGRTWDGLKEEVENSKSGETAGEVIRRWRGY